MKTSGWFGVRCIFRLAGAAGLDDATYEERVTVWRADDHDSAIRLAEAEAREYAEELDVDYLGLAQAYTMSDEPGNGAEVFSLTRDNNLSDSDYLSTFFDTGSERQACIRPDPA